jgi:hypothetical protein
VGQFYGEISVIFFLSFRLKTAFSLRAFGVFVSTQEREREECFIFERSRLFFLEEVSSAFLSRRRRCPFFSQKENKQSSFLSFASLSVFCFFSFVRFTQERLAF